MSKCQHPKLLYKSRLFIISPSTSVPQTAVFSLLPSAKVFCFLSWVSLIARNVALKTNLIQTFPETSQLPSLLSLHPQTFFGFWGIWIFLLNKEISKLACLCSCSLCAGPWSTSAFTCTRWSSLSLWCSPCQRDPKVILGQSPKVIVSDGHGFKKAEGEDHEMFGALAELS